MTRPAAAGHSESPPAVVHTVARSARAQRGPRRRDRASRMRPDLSRPAAESPTVARRAFRGRRQWQRTRADLPATGSGCAETRGRRFVTIWSNVRSRGRRRDSHYDKGELRCSAAYRHATPASALLLVLWAPPQTFSAYAAGLRLEPLRSLSGHTFPSSSAAAPRSSPQRETRPYRCCTYSHAARRFSFLPLCWRVRRSPSQGKED